jgi:hypothetical protein
MTQPLLLIGRNKQRNVSQKRLEADGSLLDYANIWRFVKPAKLILYEYRGKDSNRHLHWMKSGCL